MTKSPPQKSPERTNRSAPLSPKPVRKTPERRNESISGPREVIEQAARDIGRGLVDTDQHGVPSNVPGPRQSAQTGSDVPPGGGDRTSYSERRRVPRPDSPAPDVPPRKR